jgi:DNA repair protein RadC
MRDWISIAHLASQLAASHAADHSSHPAVSVTDAAAGEACAHRADRRPASERSYAMSNTAADARARGRRVREFVCAFRPLRDADGRPVAVPTLYVDSPLAAFTALGPLLAHEPVEVFVVACLSARHRVLAWHVLSRGTRSATAVSLPDVFVPACLTPGTTGLLVLHNHPSGDPTPSPDDVQLTRRLDEAGAILELPLLDHLIVGDGRYFSFREAGVLGGAPGEGLR